MKVKVMDIEVQIIGCNIAIGLIALTFGLWNRMSSMRKEELDLLKALGWYPCWLLLSKMFRPWWEVEDEHSSENWCPCRSENEGEVFLEIISTSAIWYCYLYVYHLDIGKEFTKIRALCVAILIYLRYLDCYLPYAILRDQHSFWHLERLFHYSPYSASWSLKSIFRPLHLLEVVSLKIMSMSQYLLMVFVLLHLHCDQLKRN